MSWQGKSLAVVERVLGVIAAAGLVVLLSAFAYALFSPHGSKSTVPFGLIIPTAAVAFAVGFWGWGWIGGIREQAREFNAMARGAGFDLAGSLSASRVGLESRTRISLVPVSEDHSRALERAATSALACAVAGSLLGAGAVWLDWHPILRWMPFSAALLALIGVAVLLWLRTPLGIDRQALAALAGISSSAKAWAAEQTASTRWLAEHLAQSRLRVGRRIYWALDRDSLSLWVRTRSELEYVFSLPRDLIHAAEAQWVPRMFDYQPGVLLDLKSPGGKMSSIRVRVVRGIGHYAAAASELSQAINSDAT
ncbi:hypothetical protein GCM10022286_23980 [Gryllotalpicola daejeonensis]|uniref:Uncharacterized protein n=1 Tax=Gryllotalpicola daejeonensis TaxID=993087 RepID=A0ABP7ZLS8_9MICO